VSSNRPQLKISVKPRGEGNGQGRISLFAFWRRDGKLSGALDKRVVELAAKLEDGTIVRVKREGDGKVSHFIDAFEESDAPTQSRFGSSGGGSAKHTAPRDDMPPDDLGVDDMPF